MTEQIEHDPALGPPAEAIHLPEPSFLPIVLAFGVMVSLVGILLGKVVVAIGLIFVVVALVKWIGSARSEMADLPLEH